MIQTLDPVTAGHVGAWLATYLAHGVALFLAACLVARFVANARVREQLWRAALFGPLLTASLQLGAGVAPLGGRWDISLAPEPALAASEPGAEPLAGVVMLLPEDAMFPAEHAEFAVAALADEPPLAAATPAAIRRRWAMIATGLLAAGIAALMIRALLETLRVQRLGRGALLSRGPIFDAANRYARRAGILRRVRVEVTERGTSPYATGVLRPRIVIPERAMAELDDRALRAMIAHELGHVARFDPLWTAAVRSVSALFFFQPLNWLIAQRLDECAEFCCDEFAVDSTGDEVALARCLAAVAGWIVGPEGARPACAMAHKRSPLGQRVERILATHGESRRRHVGARLVGALAVGATVMAAPGFAIAMDDIEPAGELLAEAPGVALAPRDFPALSPTDRLDGDPLVAIAVSLERSLAELDREIDELRALGAERELSPETATRLYGLSLQSSRLRAIVARFSDQVRARAVLRTGR